MKLALCALLVFPLAAADKYTGPVPAKADVPYLLHAENLVETEATEATQEERKDETIYSVAGESSQARTPLAEPIFILRTEKLSAERMELYQLEVKNGRRQVVFHNKKKKDGPRPIHINVTRLGDGLYRIEAAEYLENGEYSLTPAGSNNVFSFQVY